MEDSHAAIISKEMFDLVQQEFKGRNELRSSNRTGHGKYSGKYAFSGMIVCGECGETYRRHQQYNAYKKYYIWVCKRHENKGKDYCSAKPISESALERAFIRALNGLIENREKILDKLQKAVVGQISDSCEDDIAQIDKEIQGLQNGIVDLLMDKNKGRLTDKQYERETQLLKFQIDELNLKKEVILNEQGKIQLAEYRAEVVTDLLKTGKILDEFDKTIFKSLVHKIKVIGGKEIEIEFECGIKVTEKL